MKVLVLDDHALICDALRELFKALNSEAIVLDASRCEQAMRLIEVHADIQLILLDLKLPDGSGLSLLSKLRIQHPEIGVVVLSEYCDRQTVERAINVGALGYIPKSTERAVMLSALQLVLSGGVYVPPEMLLGNPAPGSGELAAEQRPSQPSDFGLSTRQIAVLALIVQGDGNKAIGHKLGMPESTVKRDVSSVLKALNVPDRRAAMIVVNNLGWQSSLREVGARQSGVMQRPLI
jgi:DNA-binding NarL/FixJ family response regulator